MQSQQQHQQQHQQQQLHQQQQQTNLPLIVYGTAGCGKSYWIRKYAKDNQMLLHICRCRRDRTLREGRERLHTLAKRYETSVIWLEGVDDLTQEAQAFLRRILETHTSTIQFVLECRDTRKLQEAIRSRCQVKHILPPTRADILKYAQTHLQTSMQPNQINEYVDYVMNNMNVSWRQATNVLKLIQTSPVIWKEQVLAGYKQSMFVPLDSARISEYINMGIDPCILLKRYMDKLQEESAEDNSEKLIVFLEKYNRVIENGGSLWPFLGGVLV